MTFAVMKFVANDQVVDVRLGDAIVDLLVLALEIVEPRVEFVRLRHRLRVGAREEAGRGRQRGGSGGEAREKTAAAERGVGHWTLR